MSNATILLTPDELRALIREELQSLPVSAPKVEQLGDVLTREQVAKMLGVNPHHVPKLIKDGLPVHWLGTLQRFLRSEVLAWIAEKH